MEWITELILQGFGDCNSQCNLCAEKYQAIRLVLMWCQIGIFSFFALTLFLLGLFAYRKRENKLDVWGLVCFGLFFSILASLNAVSLSTADEFDIFYYSEICRSEDDLLQKRENQKTKEWIKNNRELHDPSSSDTTEQELISKFKKHTLSGLNSFFLLLSFCFFSSVRNLNSKIFEPKVWAIVSLVLFIVAVLAGTFSGSDIPDVAFSTFIFIFLGIILGIQFFNRGSTEMAILAILVCCSIIYMQFYYLTEIAQFDDDLSTEPSLTAVIQAILLPKATFNFMNLILTSALGTIFLSLAFTWVFEELKIQQVRQKMEFEIQQRDDKISSLEEDLESMHSPPDILEKLGFLTETERIVFDYFIENPDNSYSQAGKSLFKSEYTIISHVRNIERKLAIKGKENFGLLQKK
ncbi:hypothetical protein [Phaeodactylibacter xiamenensis]|uniref:hypothetical protein n=1 Tax=Phaeodactylibacter xiamenensis TaxID=1524460 RepID=UPI003CCBC74B